MNFFAKDPFNLIVKTLKLLLEENLIRWLFENQIKVYDFLKNSNKGHELSKYSHEASKKKVNKKFYPLYLLGSTRRRRRRRRRRLTN